MIASEAESCRYRGVTLAVVALATASAELAIAEPGRPPGISLARGIGYSGLAIGVHCWISRRRGGRAGEGSSWTHPLVVVALLAAFASPFVVEGVRLVGSGRSEPLEVALLSALRNLGLGLGVLAGRSAFARLAALVSLFLVLAASSMAEGPAVLGTLAAYGAVGGLWLVLAYWRELRLPVDPGDRRRVPIAGPILALGFVGLAVAIAAVGPTRAATVLMGLMPSSGGTADDNPDARGGVGDGEHEVKGSQDPRSIGFTDTDVYLESDRPSLYDAVNEAYGEPIQPVKRDRMIALGFQEIEQRERPSENLRAGRQFSSVRRGGDRPGRRPLDRDAKALLYVKGPTPLHIGLAAFDRFDGRDWDEAPACVMNLPLTREPGEASWFRVEMPILSVFAGAVAHQIKIGTLDSSPMPTPAHLTRFRIGQVDRADFFGWSHEGMVRMVGRTVPAGTMIETEARTVDPARLRDVPFLAPREAAGGRRVAPEVAALATTWADGIPRGWRQVEAIVDGIRRHAAHDRVASCPPDCDDVVAHFLLRSRRGPDYLFATSAAVLLRSLDYPTRLVSGFYAAPDRYDPRTRHTPVTADDVHVWAEVRLPTGAWVAVEPTPGYELMAPAFSWSELARAAVASAWRWARSHPVWLGLAVIGLASTLRLRREIADALATLAWRTRPSADVRRYAVEALRLVERRSRWAGRPRPSGLTPRRWFGAIVPPGSGGSADLDRLIRLAEWGLHAPPWATPPESRGDGDPRDACRRAVVAWTLRRFRRLDAQHSQKELVP